MIPKESIEDYKMWLRKRGYKEEEIKPGETLRMRKRGTSPLIYLTDPGSTVISGHTPRALKQAGLFCRQTGAI